MTTGQTLLASLFRARRGQAVARAVILIAALAACVLALSGCASRKPEHTPPALLTAPYDTAGHQILWAVVPLRNESGTTAVDSLIVSDKVVAAASQIRGVRALPLNRTIATMRALGLNQLASPADAKRLAQEMGVDGIIVGSITAYDPYDPPKLGLALALYARPGAMDRRRAQILDTRELQYLPTDYQYFPRTSTFTDAPASVISEYLDAKNHQVLVDVKSYAAGRHDPNSAFGWKRYLASMDLFSEFAAWHAVSRLLDHEWIRLARTPAP
jgi:hypothetical protein